VSDLRESHFVAYVHGDLNGAKGGVYEAGHRVPFIVSWPGTVQAGTGQQPGAAAPGVTQIFHKVYSVVSDPKTNSLIIVASPQDYAVLKSVIEQLDIMRPQVLVETLIAEVSLDFTRDLGINWQVGVAGSRTVPQPVTGVCLM